MYKLSIEARAKIESLLTEIAELPEQRQFKLCSLLDEASGILIEQGAHPSDIGVKLAEAYREIEWANDDRRKKLKRSWQTFEKTKRIVCQDIRNIIE